MEYKEKGDIFYTMSNGRISDVADDRTYIGRVRADARKCVKTNKDYVKADIRMRAPTNDKKRKYYCCSCGKDYVTQKGNFYACTRSPLWKGNNGYVPICKSCSEAFYESLISFYSGNEEHALKHMCATYDWYYNEDASIMTKAQAHIGTPRISMYPSKSGTAQVARKGATYLDTVRDDEERFQKTSNILVKEELNETEDKTGEDEFEVTKAMVRTWGAGFSPSQYQFLEEEYADWISKNVCKTKAQEELFHNIALAQLDVRVARQNGGDVPKAQRALQDLMNSANILPKQNSDNVLADTQTFGTLLKKYEENDPIPEPDDRWRDVDGIRKYMNTWFRGGLAKALKIENENTRLYDEAVEEYKRYTVEPKYSEEQGSTNDVSIFDADKQDLDQSNGD